MEDNRDGDDHNNGWNCGVEGETDDPEINEIRLRQRKNFVTTLMMSQGVPMLRAGDELGHTQHGNNNAYCQDNEISWLDWNLDSSQQRFLEFCQTVVRIWHEQPVLKRRNFFQGRRIRGAGVKDIAWLMPAGGELTDQEWNSGAMRSLGVRLNGESMDEVDERGEQIVGETLLLLLNNQQQSLPFQLPRHKPSERWVPLLDTSIELDDMSDAPYSSSERYPLAGHSMVILVLKPGWSGSMQQVHQPHAESHKVHLSELNDPRR